MLKHRTVTSQAQCKVSRPTGAPHVKTPYRHFPGAMQGVATNGAPLLKHRTIAHKAQWWTAIGAFLPGNASTGAPRTTLQDLRQGVGWR